MGAREENGEAAGATLTLCVIACNEEERIAGALESVRGAASETIVLDTGSTDRTSEIAAGLGACVLRASWRDDFSAARNAALDAAKSEWILFLDADERLAPGQAALLRRLLVAPADAWFVRIRSLLGAGRDARGFVHWYPRLFRNRKGYRFRGRVHEEIGTSLEENAARIARSDLLIEHAGYALDPGRVREKLERNRRLLLLDLQDHPEDPLVLFHLGETNALLEDLAAARSYYERALRIPGVPEDLRGVLHQNLASALLRSGDTEGALAEADAALQLQPGLNACFLIRAAARGRRGEWGKALLEADRYVRECRQPVSGKRATFSFEPELWRAHSIRARAFLRFGRLREAHAAAEKIFRLNPHSPAGPELLAKVAAARGNWREEIAHYRRALEADPSRPDLWAELARAEAVAGRLREALGTVEQGLAAAKSVQLLDLQGVLRIKLGDMPGAASSYEALLQEAPAEDAARLRLAGIYRKLGQNDRARALLQGSASNAEVVPPGHTAATKGVRLANVPTPDCD